MLTQYKNINQIKSAKKSISADRIDRTKAEFLAYDIQESVYSNVSIINGLDSSKIEMHVYAGDSWITGDHQVQIQTKIPQFKDKITNQSIPINNGFGIDLYSQFNKLNLTAGTFKVAINFFKNLIGSYERQHLRIDEISTDRMEIRLRAIDDEDPEFLQQITKYINQVRQTTNPYYKNYLLNFSRNQCVLFVNSVVIGEYLYVKLYEPLPQNIAVDFKCWVVEEQKPTYIDNVSITPQEVSRQFNTLAGPNWQANYSYDTSNETTLKTWTELLGSSTQTSQQIVDAYFSGSLSGMKLNIDYSDFNNFVFYSSATERLENFKYKLELLEYYASQSLFVSQLSGSTATTNAQDFADLQTKLISGFDGFENYLYYQSSSMITTYDIPLESPNVYQLTGSYLKPAPKTNSMMPFTLAPTTSSMFKTWFDGAYSSASLYDTLNTNALSYAIPEYVRFDSANTSLITFVNMLGHHYDILYTYINHMTAINKREENPKLGMPNELLYSVAKQFGWNLTSGNQSQELWQYVLGTSEAGLPLTGSNTVGDPSVAGRDMTYTIWRRIVNNLPLLLKSKGTKRSVQALLSCYGIPQSMISINEYGGPRLDRAPVYQKLNFDYALDLSGSISGSVIVNYTSSINSVELRFRPDNVITNPLMPTTMNLFKIGSNVVTIDFSSGTKGVMKINGTGSSAIELFDGSWVSTLLRTNGSNLDLITKKSKYGKIIATVSASATASFANTGSLTLGSLTSGSRFVGQLQELRLWSSSLQDSVFENHVKAPAAYNGNVDAYSELLFRLPLTQKINHTSTSSLSGAQPKSSTISASFANWTLASPYDSIEETYYYDSISLGAGTFDDNKIRLESNELVGNLDVKTRAERSQFDKAPLDSKKLGVYFSPQTMIDEDIIAQLGFTDLDQYIGDPGSTESDSYPRLIQAAQNYWKKYSNRNNINSYISMFSLFDLSFFKQLEQLLPARADKLLGILIQPNALERNKQSILPKIARYDSGYTTIIYNVAPTASADYPFYEGTADGKILTLTANDDDQWQMYLTASNEEKYGGFPYSYEYLLRSGSTYITASSPYWISEGLNPTYTTSTYSEFKLSTDVTFITSSLVSPKIKFSGSLVQFQDYLPTGINNQRYAGSKLTSPAFNINSTQTIDGGPVVEWRTANANQLIYQNNGEQGSFVLV